MKFLYMVFVNCKRYFKDYKIVALMFLVPILTVLFVNFMTNTKSTDNKLNLKTAVVNLDKGNLGKELVEKINAPEVYDNKKEALEALKNYDVIAVYEIGENFTQEMNENKKPIINSYRLEQGNSVQIFEVQIEQKINELYKANVLKKYNIIKNENELNKNVVNLEYNTEKKIISSNEFIPIILIMFFLVSFSCTISTDLLILKQEKILERFLSTGNKGYEIIGSIYLSMMITQITLYTASFMTIRYIFNIDFDNFGILMINIALMSMVSISLGIMVNRIFKDKGVVTIVISLTAVIMFFLYMGGVIGETSTKIPKVIVTLSKFTPFYWSLGSIENAVLFPNVFVLILIVLIFFSAGSIKYSNFAKEAK